MNIKPVISAIALIALAGALLAAAVALNDAQVSPTQSANTQPSATVAGALDAELARCNAIGPEAASDAVCKAVWEANRKRFFESRIVRSNRRVENHAAIARNPERQSFHVIW